MDNFHTVREAVCRNPKCFTHTYVYINGSALLPPSGFYVFTCPRCGKQVPFPPDGLQRIAFIPSGAIVAKALE